MKMEKHSHTDVTNLKNQVTFDWSTEFIIT